MNRTNKVCVSTTPMLMSLALQAVLSPLAVHAAEVLLPNLRSTYHVAEPIEVAVAGLESDTNAKCTFQRIADDAPAFSIDIPSDGSTQTVRLAPFSLAPGEYQINVTGAAQPTKLTVGHGVPRSTMFVTQVGNSQAGGNVEVTNAFGFGLLTPQGAPDVNPRRISGMMLAKEKLFAENKPDLIYMYWTGYVLHKPWGIHKEWCSPDMTENMRLFNFHVAQRLRRYDRNILMIGCIDEPGLPWGKTPAGGSATGFPGWNTAKWYEERGWTYTNNPASGSDADWLKYMGIRSSMLGEQTKQANDDIKQVWPTVTFSSDL